MSKVWHFLLGCFILFFCLSIGEADNGSNYFEEPYFENPSSEKGIKSKSEQKTLDNLAVSGVLPDYPWIPVKKYRGYDTEKCLSCHQGIEEISDSHPLKFGCTICHGGRGDTEEKEEAHSTLIYISQPFGRRGNPSHLESVEQSCGQKFCHAGHNEEDRNLVPRVKKSMMAVAEQMATAR